MKKVTDLTENEVIHCPTEREAEAICLLMHNAGLKWDSGMSFLEETHWSNFRENMCYKPTTRLNNSLKHFKEQKFTIHPASDFLPEHFYLGLPLYFVVKNDNSKEGREYIEWLNKTFKEKWAGNCCIYYGFTGNKNERSGTEAHDSVRDFQNNPTVFNSPKEFFNLLNKNTMQTEVKIQVPQGYEIDKENSTFELIKFKKIEKKFPKSWEELGEITGYFIDLGSDVVAVGVATTEYPSNKNIFATEEQAKVAIALAQLSQLKKVYREIEGGEIDWASNSSKYTISFRKEGIEADWTIGVSTFLAFNKAETRDLFFENFKDLIEQAKPLMVGE
jgi:hypothetical protein